MTKLCLPLFSANFNGPSKKTEPFLYHIYNTNWGIVTLVRQMHSTHNMTNKLCQRMRYICIGIVVDFMSNFSEC